MRGYDLFCVYRAVKLHFTSNYDYFKYNGKTNLTPEGFECRKDKHSFNKLARTVTEDMAVNFFVANIIDNPNKWTRELNDSNAMEIYRKWQSDYDNRYTIFEKEFQQLLTGNSNIEDQFKSFGGTYPELLSCYLRKEISPITIISLNSITNCFDDWDKLFENDFIYTNSIKLLRKMTPFLALDRHHLRSITKKALTS